VVNSQLQLGHGTWSRTSLTFLQKKSAGSRKKLMQGASRRIDMVASVRELKLIAGANANWQMWAGALEVPWVRLTAHVFD